MVDNLGRIRYQIDIHQQRTLREGRGQIEGDHEALRQIYERKIWPT